MDAPASKRAYALLSISLTRFLAGDPTGSRELRRQAVALPELARAREVLDLDLDRLEAARPEWRDTIEAYRGGDGL